MHALTPAAEYLPAAQAAVSAVSPVPTQYEPAGQLTHDVDPTLGWYSPAAQLGHALAPPDEYLPAAHAAVTAERPVVAQ